MLVEASKSVLGKRRRRAQLAGAKRRQWPPRGSDMFRGSRKAFGQRQQRVKTHAFDLKAGVGRSPARILKHRRDEGVIAGRKILRHLWLPWMALFELQADALGAVEQPSQVEASQRIVGMQPDQRGKGRHRRR